MNNYNPNSLRILADGVFTSNNTRKTGLNNNDLIIGGSGSGKTGGYVVPNLENLSGSMVVIDTKHALERTMRAKLERKGFEVHVLDFVDSLESEGYNPLRNVRWNSHTDSFSDLDISTIAHAIAPQDVGNSDPFWNRAAEQWVEAVIALTLEAVDDHEVTMLDVLDMSDYLQSKDGQAWLNEWRDHFPESVGARRVLAALQSAPAEKTWQSVMMIAKDMLHPFSLSERHALLGENGTIDLGALGERPSVLFVNVSDSDRSANALLNVFYIQLFHELIRKADASKNGRLRVPVRIILDDFAASARIDDFDKIISVIRSREISVSVVLQSLSQLQAAYGPAKANTIINNCDHIIYLGGNDLETATYLSARMDWTRQHVLELPRTDALVLEAGARGKQVAKVPPYSKVRMNPEWVPAL